MLILHLWFEPSSLRKFHLYMHDYRVILIKIHYKFFCIVYLYLSLTYVYSSVTEVVWEGEETEPKKDDKDTTKKADTVTKKADNTSTKAVNGLVLFLHLNWMNEILEVINTSKAAWLLVRCPLKYTAILIRFALQLAVLFLKLLQGLTKNSWFHDILK